MRAQLQQLCIALFSGEHEHIIMLLLHLLYKLSGEPSECVICVGVEKKQGMLICIQQL
jgi:hypothetical protein